MLASLPSVAGNGWFGWAPYGQPMYADMHPEHARLDISAVSMNPAYDYGKSGGRYQVHTIGTFGLNLPVWSGDLGDGRFGLNVTLPLSATLWMDIAEKVTSAVVNTDYRIGCPSLTFIHRFGCDGGNCEGQKRFARNYSIRLQAFKHESTHVGDELVLQRSSEAFALKRVNVSYNFAELAFTLNEPENRCMEYHSFRAALMIPYFIRNGWYFVEERDGDIGQVPGAREETNSAGNRESYGPAISAPEWYLQYQWQSKTAKCGIQGIVSAELRGRALYGYDLSAKEGAPATSATRDAYTLTVNGFAGIRYNGGRDGFFSRFALGVRGYWGNCPYGMFRSIGNFSQFGLCLIFQ